MLQVTQQSQSVLRVRGLQHHTERQQMNTWTAPLIVAILSIIAATLVNEPAAAIFGIGVALCGYAINKADNRDV